MSSAAQPISSWDTLHFSDKNVKVKVGWNYRRAEKSSYFEVITLPVQIEADDCESQDQSGSMEEKLAALRRLLEEYLAEPMRKGPATLQLVIPRQRCFGARGNAFRDQLNAYAPLLRYWDQSEFAKEYSPPITRATPSLIDILPHSVCTVLFGSSLANLDTPYDLMKIISFPWFLQVPPQLRKCVLVHGRDSIEAFQPLAETAYDLGIKLIVLDRPDHWLLMNPQYKSLYNEFVSIDMTVDEDFPRRIAGTVKVVTQRQGRIDGIFTVSDRCLLPVSKAAEVLNLPTDFPHSFATAIDKSASRRLCADESISFLSIQQPSELNACLKAGTFHEKYPLIVKPSTGWSSEHVFRVKNEAELYLAAERVATRRNTKILIEPFIDGPEVDANFVLCDGELLFFEVSDDFPSSADRDGAGMESNFFETTNVLPSALPKVEVDLIRDRLHMLLLQMEFRTGVFHLEARMINSSMEFAADENGALDLRPRQLPSKELRSGERGDVKCFLIEINPRPPGFQSVHATRLMYGIDYFALHMLASIGDKERLQGLGRSFWDRVSIGSCSSGNRGGFWCSIVFITGSKGGVCHSTDSVEDLLKRSPDLKDYIKMGMSFFKKGDRIPHSTPEKLVFLGFFLVLSRSTRADVIDAARRIQMEFEMEII